MTPTFLRLARFALTERRGGDEGKTLKNNGSSEKRISTTPSLPSAFSLPPGAESDISAQSSGRRTGRSFLRDAQQSKRRALVQAAVRYRREAA